MSYGGYNTPVFVAQRRGRYLIHSGDLRLKAGAGDTRKRRQTVAGCRVVLHAHCFLFVALISGVRGPLCRPCFLNPVFCCPSSRRDTTLHSEAHPRLTLSGWHPLGRKLAWASTPTGRASRPAHPCPQPRLSSQPECPRDRLSAPPPGWGLGGRLGVGLRGRVCAVGCCQGPGNSVIGVPRGLPGEERG